MAPVRRFLLINVMCDMHYNYEYHLIAHIFSPVLPTLHRPPGSGRFDAALWKFPAPQENRPLQHPPSVIYGGSMQRWAWGFTIKIFTIRYQTLYIAGFDIFYC